MEGLADARWRRQLIKTDKKCSAELKAEAIQGKSALSKVSNSGPETNEDTTYTRPEFSKSAAKVVRRPSNHERLPNGTLASSAVDELTLTGETCLSAKEQLEVLALYNPKIFLGDIKSSWAQRLANSDRPRSALATATLRGYSSRLAESKQRPRSALSPGIRDLRRNNNFGEHRSEIKGITRFRARAMCQQRSNDAGGPTLHL